jgi:hypothetical protein
MGYTLYKKLGFKSVGTLHICEGKKLALEVLMYRLDPARVSLEARAIGIDVGSTVSRPTI